MTTAEELLLADVETKSDINEHLETLRAYARECDHVTEMGCWRGYSACALLNGLMDVSGGKLVVYDFDQDYLDRVEKKLRPVVPDNVEMELNLDSTIRPDLEIEETDLLFIDTLHTYDQLLKELKQHHEKVRKYILLHDVVSFGVVGEDRKSPGLQDAYEDFLDEVAGGVWEVRAIHENNNGLAILQRV